MVRRNPFLFIRHGAVFFAFFSRNIVLAIFPGVADNGPGLEVTGLEEEPRRLSSRKPAFFCKISGGAP
jgi:hypothetical protein